MVRLISLIALAVLGGAPRTAMETTPRTFRNPLKVNGADPWLQYVDGWYYLTATTSTEIKMRRARHMNELAKAEDQVVWQDSTPGRAIQMWATEFWLLEGGHGKRWYGYYTASDHVDEHHRMYVLESEGSDPRGPYHFKGQLLTDAKNEHYAIDGSVIHLADGRLFFVWCGRPSSTGQGLYISKMSNPWTLVGDRHYLEASGFGCPVVREGPIGLQHNGKVFLIYSMCPAEQPDYRLGMLVADAKSDLSDPKSWSQHPSVVFSRNDAAGVYGPGHNSFFKSPDGKEDWIVYHAKSGTEVTYRDRSARAQKFTWNRDGTPNFGVPLRLDVDIPVPSGEPK